MGLTVHGRALHRAAQILGGKEKLRRHLHVPMHLLEDWMSGAERPPMEVFLKAVDLICAPSPQPEAVRRSVRLPIRRDKVQAALDAALRVTGAPRGNLQLASADGLRIVAQRGFEQPFLDFFACVRDEASACGVALMHGRRVIVADVARDPIFAGTPAGGVMLQAGARAVQSTPLLAASGEVIGVLSTHYDRPWQPGEHELAMLDDIARTTASWLEGSPRLRGDDAP